MDFSAGGQQLLDYWGILVRRRWVILLAVISVSLVALIGSFLLTPLYRATATVQIERHSPDILTFRDLARVDYSWAAYADYYQTQYKLISSAGVARRAVERLGLMDHPEFDGSRSSPGLLARLRALIPRRGTRVQLDPLDRVAMRIQSGLEVSPIRNSQLVRVSWVGDDPILAAQVANAIADSYIKFNIESRYSTSGQAEEFLVDQTATLKSEINVIETQLQEYGESKRIISIDRSSNITLQALQDIARKRTSAQTTLAQAAAHRDAVRTADPGALPEVMHSTLISRLRQEHAQYEADLSKYAKQFREHWPELQHLRSKMEQAQQRLDAEIDQIARQVRASAETAYENARNEVENLGHLLDEHETASQRLKRDAVEFANLQSEVEKKRETLDALIGRQNEMALSTRLADPEAIPSNVRITEPARAPTGPFRPNTRLNLMLGVMFGLGLGVVTAFFLDYIDNTINSPVELARHVSFPLLAVVPRIAEASAPSPRGRRQGPMPVPAPDLLSHRDSRAPASEAYRELRTSLLLSNPGHPPRRIVVTSSVPEEGKTATAINLGIVLAQLGRRVVIVDADLRRPRLHEPFRIDRSAGVSTFLSGLEQDPLTLIRKTEIEHLEILPAGPIPPNPSELLNSARFAELGTHLLDHGYDHVIFDSPPALSVSDPVIIASVVETGILVVRAGRTARQSVRLAVSKFEQSGVGHFGVVLNGVETSGPASYYRYHYYGRNDTGESSSDSTHVAGA